MSFPDHYLPGLRLLLLRWQQARNVALSPWEFPVELSQLRNAGLATSDLRWLVTAGFIHCRSKKSAGKARGQAHKSPAQVAVSDRCLFVLTEAGAMALKSIPGLGLNRPYFDIAARQLYVAGTLVKEFRRDAPNQIAILTEFERQGWVLRIEDPLPWSSEVDAKERLHETIKSLNQNQIRPMIRFSSDGLGTGIKWGLLEG